MVRTARHTVLGYPHEVTQRGNYDQSVFEEEADYSRYLEWLSEYSHRYALDIWAYCLIENHVHFVCVPRSEAALARTFNTLHMHYSQYFNRKKGQTGHLWRGRFLSCMLDDQSVFEEIRFVENNPVRLKIVEKAEDYPWSSARGHIFGTPDPVLRDGNLLGERIRDWREYLSGVKNEDVLGRVRRHLRTGRPAGDNGFIRGLEEVTGQRMAPMPRGRPRKATSLSAPPLERK